MSAQRFECGAQLDGKTVAEGIEVQQIDIQITGRTGDAGKPSEAAPIVGDDAGRQSIFDLAEGGARTTHRDAKIVQTFRIVTGDDADLDVIQLRTEALQNRSERGIRAGFGKNSQCIVVHGEPYSRRTRSDCN